MAALTPGPDPRSGWLRPPREGPPARRSICGAKMAWRYQGRPGRPSGSRKARSARISRRSSWRLGGRSPRFSACCRPCRSLAAAAPSAAGGGPGPIEILRHRPGGAGFVDELAQTSGVGPIVQRQDVSVGQPERQQAPELDERDVIAESRVGNPFQPVGVVVEGVIHAIRTTEGQVRDGYAKEVRGTRCSRSRCQTDCRPDRGTHPQAGHRVVTVSRNAAATGMCAAGSFTAAPPRSGSD